MWLPEDIVFFGCSNRQFTHKQAIDNQSKVQNVQFCLWRFQKNGNNGEMKYVSPNQKSLARCPVRATRSAPSNATRSLTLWVNTHWPCFPSLALPTNPPEHYWMLTTAWRQNFLRLCNLRLQHQNWHQRFQILVPLWRCGCCCCTPSKRMSPWSAYVCTPLGLQSSL